MQDAVKTIIEYIGEDPERDGLKRTPLRVEKSFAYLTKGYAENPDQILTRHFFPLKAKEP